MQTIRQLTKWIRDRDDIAIVPHVSPDGDAIGSALALKNLLEWAGKRACIVCVDPVAWMYAFLPGTQMFRTPDNLPFVPRAVLYEDVAALDRAGDKGAFSGIADTAVLDHHETNPGFAGINVVDGDAAATGEMVVRLMDDMGMPLDPETALCLYAAIATDTGNFSYANTHARVIRIFARLMETGFDMPEANRRLFRLRTLARARLLGAALDAMALTDGGKIAYTRVTRAMFDRFHATHADTEGIVNALSEIEGVVCALIAEEREPLVTKCSMRSANDFDVSGIARAFGGGGHKNAAGMTVAGCDGEEAVMRALDAIRAQLA